jgi:hypothetical protein
MSKSPIEFELRCRAFSGEGVRANWLRVTADDVVLAYDSVAGHYTRCHSLTPATERRALAKAARIRQRISTMYTADRYDRMSAPE